MFYITRKASRIKPNLRSIDHLRCSVHPMTNRTWSFPHKPSAKGFDVRFDVLPCYAYGISSYCHGHSVGSLPYTLPRQRTHTHLGQIRCIPSMNGQKTITRLC